MEKYSSYRDAGTGIQPFLHPVSPSAPTLLTNSLVPIGYLIGAIRLSLILLAGTVYLLIQICLRVLYPVAPLRRFLSRVTTSILARLILVLVGLWWIPVTHITRKRGRGAVTKASWTPQSGDLIVSNWASWVEILWLAFRFDPLFVLPISQPITKPSSSAGISTPNSRGRSTGTGSAVIASPAFRPPATRVPILGFRTISLWGMLRLTGHVPPFGGQPGDSRSLERIRREASRPVVVFPECTTSNGRAMLHFAEVFGNSTLPIKNYNVFIMAARYDPPTLYAPTLTCSIPSPSAFHPLPHIFQVASSLSPSLYQSLSIRLLAPAESPSSRSFLASDVLTEGGHSDEVAAVCAGVIAQLGKMRMTGLAWEDKIAFLEFYQGKTRRVS